MLIINADDWGGWRQATDAAYDCYRNGRITSVTAMVFMEDSARAAELARTGGLDVGLHLNLTAAFTGPVRSALLMEYHRRIRRFLTISKYAVLVYNPFLINEFRYVFEAQVEEFVRLYDRPPSHIDGHQHKHLCANLVLGAVVPEGQKIRRNFSFSPGEKRLVNRLYRAWIDARLQSRYRMTDFFFSLGPCLKTNRLRMVHEIAKRYKVELMTHPQLSEEYACLMSDAWLELLHGVQTGTYAML